MQKVINTLIGLNALIHGYILWLEMFAWTTRGPKVFSSVPAELFELTQPMAFNQGLYNGFLAAGLIWALVIRDPLWSRKVAVFFLACIAVAGIVGAMSVQISILYVQTIPAALTLLAIFMHARSQSAEP